MSIKLLKNVVSLGLIGCAMTGWVAGCASEKKSATETSTGATAGTATTKAPANAPSTEFVEKQKADAAKMAQSQKAGEEAFKKYAESKNK